MDDSSNPPSGLNDLSSEALLSLGDSHYVDENYDDAVNAYAAAITLFRKPDVARHIRALSHRSAAFYKLARYEEALQDARDSLDLFSKKKSSVVLRTGSTEGEIFHRRAGLALFQMKRYQESKEALQMAAQLASLNKRTTNRYDSMLNECDAKLTHSKKIEPFGATAPSIITPSSMKVEKKATGKVHQKLPSSPKSSPTRASKEIYNAAFISPPTTSKRSITAPKYQYYQSDNVMTISILETGAREEDLTVRLEPTRLHVILKKNGSDFTIISGALYSEIDVQKSKVVFKPEKILLKLRKVDPYEWHELLGKADDSSTEKARSIGSDQSKKDAQGVGNIDDDAVPSVENATISNDKNKSRPYTSHRDWDAIEKNIILEEKNEKPEGDEAMNKLFKQIYADASEDTRRAMIKSYQTSGGTVLSTNWDEVKKKDYEKERTAPEGVEWKNWNNEKIPMKEENS